VYQISISVDKNRRCSWEVHPSLGHAGSRPGRRELVLTSLVRDSPTASDPGSHPGQALIRGTGTAVPTASGVGGTRCVTQKRKLAVSEIVERSS